MTYPSFCETEDERYLDGLPKVTDEMLTAAIKRIEGHVMTFEERQVQLVSFVWGNALESDRGTREKVCEHLHVPFC